MDVDFEAGQLADGVDDDENFPPEASDNSSAGGMVLQEHDPFNDPPSDPQGIEAEAKSYVMLFVWIFSPHLLSLSSSAEVANSLSVRKRAPPSTSVAIVSAPVKRKFLNPSALLSTAAKRTKHSSQQLGDRISSLSHASRFMTSQGTIKTLLRFAKELTEVSLMKKKM